MSASNLQKKLQLNKLPPMPPAAVGRGAAHRPPGGRKRDYTPVSWDNYFSSSEDVLINNKDRFRVYKKGSSGPVVLLLHGGGFSALTWSLMTSHLANQVECQCVAVDLRGHGDTQTENETTLSADVQANDVGHVISSLYGDDPPPIILVGHSMGGAIAVHVGHKDILPSLIGLVVIDVVEGTALEALSGMQSFLRGRPRTFKSMEHAIEWCVRTGHVRNLDSARVSMTGQIKRLDVDEVILASDEVIAATSHPNIIQEENEEELSQNINTDNTFKEPQKVEPHKYTWRINLSTTEPHWQGWFRGLSNTFLSVPVPKMLVLAGVDRLDKDLSVGQMQGKFQLQVLPQCGHIVHEDAPDKVADVLATFMVRNKFAEPKPDFHRTFPAC